MLKMGRACAASRSRCRSRLAWRWAWPWGRCWARAEPLGELGKLVIQLIKAVATPLLFFAIVDAILRTEVRGRQGAIMLAFAAASSSMTWSCRS